MDNGNEYTKEDITRLSQIEKENIRMLILYRSLFILKKKFDKYQDDILKIYLQYKIAHRKVTTISIQSFKELFLDITTQLNFLIIPFNNYMELLNADFLEDINKRKCVKLLPLLEKHFQSNINKYNLMLYNKHQRKGSSYNEENAEEGSQQSSLMKQTDLDKDISEYTKRGDIVYTTEQLKSLNNELLTQGHQKVDDIINSKNEFFPETFMLALADFIQSNKQIAIIDISEELKEELELLFDTQIITKLNKLAFNNPQEEKNKKIKEALIDEMNVKKLVKYYNELLMQKTSKNENTAFIEKMLFHLMNKQKAIQTSIRKINEEYEAIINKVNKLTPKQVDRDNDANSTIINNEESDNNPSIMISYAESSSRIYSNVSKIKPKATLEEKRKAALIEIYYFYSKQHSFAGHDPTFDALSQRKNELYVSDFAKFCVDFKIRVQKNKLNDLFIKTALNSKYLTKDDFLIIIRKLARAEKEEKKAYLSEQINLLLMKKKANEIENKQICVPIYKSQQLYFIKNRNHSNLNSNKQKTKLFPMLNVNSDDLQDQIIKLKTNYEKLCNESVFQEIESMYVYLEIDHEVVYRKKMKGFSHPFNHPNQSAFPNIKNNLYMKITPKPIKERKEPLVLRKVNIANEKNKQREEIKDKDILIQRKHKHTHTHSNNTFLLKSPSI